MSNWSCWKKKQIWTRFKLACQIVKLKVDEVGNGLHEVGLGSGLPIWITKVWSYFEFSLLINLGWWCRLDPWIFGPGWLAQVELAGQVASTDLTWVHFLNQIGNPNPRSRSSGHIGVCVWVAWNFTMRPTYWWSDLFKMDSISYSGISSNFILIGVGLP